MKNIKQIGNNSEQGFIAFLKKYFPGIKYQKAGQSRTNHKNPDIRRGAFSKPAPVDNLGFEIKHKEKCALIKDLEQAGLDSLGTGRVPVVVVDCQGKFYMFMEAGDGLEMIKGENNE